MCCFCFIRAWRRVETALVLRHKKSVPVAAAASSNCRETSSNSILARTSSRVLTTGVPIHHPIITLSSVNPYVKTTLFISKPPVTCGYTILWTNPYDQILQFRKPWQSMEDLSNPSLLTYNIDSEYMNSHCQNITLYQHPCQGYDSGIHSGQMLSVYFHCSLITILMIINNQSSWIRNCCLECSSLDDSNVPFLFIYLTGSRWCHFWPQLPLPLVQLFDFLVNLSTHLPRLGPRQLAWNSWQNAKWRSLTVRCSLRWIVHP